LADNPSLMEAVKEVLVRQFDMPKFENDVSDTIIGQAARARATGIAAIDTAFAEIARQRTLKEKVSLINSAR
jgi:hypothetical protein